MIYGSFFCCPLQTLGLVSHRVLLISSCLILMDFDIVIGNKVAGGKDTSATLLETFPQQVFMHSDLAVLGNHWEN